MLSREVLYAAVKNNDARLDGKFFVGVKSTGIYCRSVCKARTPKANNCVSFETAAQAEEAGLDMECRVSLPAQTPHNEMDLCIVLGNALENAIQACRKISDGPRSIRLSLALTENRRLTLEVENSCPLPVAFSDDGLPVSSAPKQAFPEEEHGLGLRSVKAIVEHCGGLLRCRWEEGVFYFRAVLFPAPEPVRRQ